MSLNAPGASLHCIHWCYKHVRSFRKPSYEDHWGIHKRWLSHHELNIWTNKQSKDWGALNWSRHRTQQGQKGQGKGSGSGHASGKALSRRWNKQNLKSWVGGHKVEMERKGFLEKWEHQQHRAVQHYGPLGGRCTVPQGSRFRGEENERTNWSGKKRHDLKNLLGQILILR